MFSTFIKAILKLSELVYSSIFSFLDFKLYQYKFNFMKNIDSFRTVNNTSMGFMVVLSAIRNNVRKLLENMKLLL